MVRAHHDHRGRVIERRDFDSRLADDLGRQLLALRVLLLKALGDGIRGFASVRHQEVEGEHGVFHPPRRVDPRPQLKRQVLRRDRRPDARHGEQGRASRAGRLIETMQAGPDDRPVFRVQWHDIRDRSEGDRIERRRRIELAGKGAPLQRDQQFVGDATGRQTVEGIGAIRLLGVDEGVDRRPVGADFVMIGDDQPHPRGPITRDVDGVGAAVTGDDEAGSARIEVFQGLEIEAVALGESIGDIGDDIGPSCPKTARQRDARRHAIGVVIAIHGDALPTMNRFGDQIACDRHVLEQKGIRRSLKIGLEPGRELRLAGDAAGVQHLTEHRGEGLQSW